jgi:putative ABC transport system permease protein
MLALARGIGAMTMIEDLKYTFRSLFARKGFSLLVIAVLTAGLSCVIFMAAMLDGLIIRPVPFDAPDQLLQAGTYEEFLGKHYLDDADEGDLLEIRRQLSELAQVGGYSPSFMSLSGNDLPEREYGAVVTANLFQLLRVAPMAGRDFDDADQTAGAPPVAIISYDIWLSRYGADRSIIGHPIRVNGQPVTLIGIMPRGFAFPSREAVWMAAHLSETAKADSALAFQIVLRRNDESTDAAIETALSTWFASASHADPDRFRGKKPAIHSIEGWGATLLGLLYVMLAAVALLLLVACANAGNLILARTLGRRQEMSVRLALGATQKRLVVNIVMESIVLCLIATVLSAAIASKSMSWLLTWFKANNFGPTLWQQFHVDGRVLLFAIVVGLATAIAAALPAAWISTSESAIGNLRDGTRAVTSRSMTRMGNILVTGEVALSCALLVSVLMMVRMILLVDSSDIGVRTDGLLTAHITLSQQSFPTRSDQLRFFESLKSKFQANPIVMDVTAGTALPGTLGTPVHSLVAVGSAIPEGQLPHAKVGAVDDHFLSTFGITLQEGRAFDDRDTADGVSVAIVDRRFVERFSPEAPVLGRQFQLDPRDPNGTTVTVVGVIGPVMLNTRYQPPQPTMLVPVRQGQGTLAVANLTARTQGESKRFISELDKIVRGVDADTPMDLHDYSEVVLGQTKTIHIIAIWFEVLGSIALLIAAAGLYGVTAVNVGRRTREIGVRRALGATHWRILRNIFSRSFVHFGAGLVFGTGAGILFARIL